MKRQNRDIALNQVREIFRRSWRPVLIGPTSMALGPFWTIAHTEELFQELLILGEIRYVTPREQRDYDCDYGFMRVALNISRPESSYVRTKGEVASDIDFDDVTIPVEADRKVGT